MILSVCFEAIESDIHRTTHFDVVQRYLHDFLVAPSQAWEAFFLISCGASGPSKVAVEVTTRIIQDMTKETFADLCTSFAP